jgi:exonuclease III
MRIVTWNLNTPFTRSDSRAHQWAWLDEHVSADIAVLTEAEIPKSGLPDGWTALYQVGGIGENRRWGTVIAARPGVELRDITTGVEGKGGFVLQHTRPGTVVVADVVKKNKVVATLVGIYAMTRPLNDDGKKKSSDGYEACLEVISDLQPLFESKRGKRLILAGDFNMWPKYLPPGITERFFDAVLETEKTRQSLGYCCDCSGDEMCGHMWTHWNRSAPQKVQNLDYIFFSKKLFMKLGTVTGGRKDFPEAAQFSDHAPVVAEFHL